MDMVINTCINSKNELEIYVGNCILATITDGIETEEFIEDVLDGMGYIWNADGTITKMED